MATRGVLKLREITAMDPNCPINYFIPGRASSEPCENAFSQARRQTGEANPGALKLVQHFRLASVTQSVRLPKNCSYLDAGGETALVLSASRY